MKNLILLLTCIALAATSLVAQTKRRPQAKPKVDLAKKITDATPAALPQGPRTGKTISDASDLNLKGKVKVVTEYSLESNGTREIVSEKYFDEKGFLTKDINYEDGYPSSVTVWGWIDGERVLKSNDIEYAEGEKPPARNLIITEAYVPSAKYADKIDDRYDVKYLYKFDDVGRLVEKTQLRNTGETWGRTTYSYTGDRKEERYFGRGGNEWSHTTYVLDKNGETVERWDHGENDKVVDNYTYRRTLDAQGNWIAEKTFEKKTVRGKTVQKLLWTSYRTITYYP
jgi:hypothetical protein